MGYNKNIFWYITLIHVFAIGTIIPLEYLQCVDYCSRTQDNITDSICFLGCRFAHDHYQCSICDRVLFQTLFPTKNTSHYKSICTDGCLTYNTFAQQNNTQEPLRCIIPNWVNDPECYYKTIYHINNCCFEFNTNPMCHSKYSLCDQHQVVLPNINISNTTTNTNPPLTATTSYYLTEKTSLLTKDSHYKYYHIILFAVIIIVIILLIFYFLKKIVRLRFHIKKKNNYIQHSIGSQYFDNPLYTGSILPIDEEGKGNIYDTYIDPVDY